MGIGLDSGSQQPAVDGLPAGKGSSRAAAMEHPGIASEGTVVMKMGSAGVNRRRRRDWRGRNGFKGSEVSGFMGFGIRRDGDGTRQRWRWERRGAE